MTGLAVELMESLLWKEIPGFSGYEASSSGDVRSWRLSGMHGGRRAKRPRTLKPNRDRRGYLWVTIVGDDGRYRKVSVHSAVLMAHVGPRPDGMEARHFPDRSPANNRLENLSWSSHVENVRDQVIHGTKIEGSRIGNSKLSESDVSEILASTESLVSLARRYGVSPSTMSCVKRGKRWLHVEGNRSDSCRPRGSRHCNSKLTDAQVKLCRESNMTTREIVERFGISKASAQALRAGKTWRHLLPDSEQDRQNVLAAQQYGGVADFGEGDRT